MKFDHRNNRSVMGRFPFWILFGLTLLTVSLNDVLASDGGDIGPSESECRPYIEKAINELKTGEHNENEDSSSPDTVSGEDVTNYEADKETSDSTEQRRNVAGDDDEDDDDGNNDGSEEESRTKTSEAIQTESKEEVIISGEESGIQKSAEEELPPKSGEEQPESSENEDEVDSRTDEERKTEEDNDNDDDGDDDQKSGEEAAEANAESSENEKKQKEDDGIDSEETIKVSDADDNNKDDDDNDDGDDDGDDDEQNKDESGAPSDPAESSETPIDSERSKRSIDNDAPSAEDDDIGDTDEEKDGKDGSIEAEVGADEVDDESTEAAEGSAKESKEDAATSSELKTDMDEAKSDVKADEDDTDSGEKSERGITSEEVPVAADSKEKQDESSKEDEDAEGSAEKEGSGEETEEEETKPEDELLWEGEIPEILRNRNHIYELLQLDEEFEAKEKAVDRVAEIILRDIKRIYESGIKPLETMYKYRDLSNRHFSDPEIFSKPLVLFMGPWSGGKSSIINYLTGNEYTPNSLRTGAEPSPAYFNILMWGNETEVLDGTQLAADYTFSGLQKFGQGLEDRLRGLKLPSKLLEKVNIVEIPGILEVRKQVSRLFPFNDACQWFIDRADIIFLVYDPAKLDVGPETEAILDQLKGREYQTRIILNKADTVKPEELLRIQSALIWNISPIMSSAQPPLMYTTSLWSHPYESGAPVRLLQAQERAFLRDMRAAIEKRIEHKISSARRFAVRVRNHVKMVDCYLNTYYNHKTLFGNKKRIADNIIEHPQNYHIYEGLSTLTNISRYDLPDPEVYRDFFQLNPLYEFKRLAETCTYFRGCPINKLDIAIAYELPELAGKYKKMAEAALAKIERSELSKS